MPFVNCVSDPERPANAFVGLRNSTDPVNACRSSVVSPNFVEPLLKIMLEETKVDLSSYTCNVPETLMSCLKSTSPVKVVPALIATALVSTVNCVPPRLKPAPAVYCVFVSVEDTVIWPLVAEAIVTLVPPTRYDVPFVSCVSDPERPALNF